MVNGMEKKHKIQEQLPKEEIKSVNLLNLKILLLSIGVGLIFNWISFYLSIVLGFLSIGVGSLVILLIAKMLFRRREITDSELALITIAYRGTTAAEASVGLLFIIWLTFNAKKFFKIDFNPPSWLLPPNEILTSRIILSTTWILPLLVHWFLMLIPGLMGISFGWAIHKKFVENEKDYPFPGIIQTKILISVVASKESKKRQIFVKYAILSFFISFISTIFLPYLDFSTNRQVIGIMFGIVGVTMFSVGFIVKDPKITIFPFFASLLFYTLVPIYVLPPDFSTAPGFINVFNAILAKLYLPFLIGLLIGALFLGSLLRGILKRKSSPKNEIIQTTATPSEKLPDGSNPELRAITENKRLFNRIQIQKIVSNNVKLLNHLIYRHFIVILIFAVLYGLSLIFTLYLRLLPVPFYVTAIVLFWILIVGNIVNGYIVTQSVAKSSSSAEIPFIFSQIPIYLADGRGFIPYLVIPSAETRETTSMVTSLKLASIFRLSSKDTLVSYLAGYLAAILTTPLFALLLWHSFGIGSERLPAPAFPLLASIVGAFAVGNPLLVFDPVQMIIGLIIGIILGSNIGLGAVLGLLFPFPMIIPFSAGGLTRYLTEKRYDPKIVEDRGNFIFTAISVGASLAIFPLIIFALLL